VKYLRRRLAGQSNRNKNLVAVTPSLLALLMTLVRQERPYQERPDAVPKCVVSKPNWNARSPPGGLAALARL
jgi:hypothetical protein